MYTKQTQLSSNDDCHVPRLDEKTIYPIQQNHHCKKSLILLIDTIPTDISALSPQPEARSSTWRLFFPSTHTYSSMDWQVAEAKPQSCDYRYHFMTSSSGR